MSWKDRRSILNLTTHQMEEWVGSASCVVQISALSTEMGILPTPTIKFSTVVGIGIKDEIIGTRVEDLNKLRLWLSEKSDMVLGYFSYDLKNLLENLESINSDRMAFPLFHFFVPRMICFVDGDEAECYYHGEIPDCFDSQDSAISRKIGDSKPQPQKSEYVEKVKELQKHIQLGDIYEVNYCIEHGFEETVVDPYGLYKELQEVSPAPFSCYVADNGKYLMSSSPERFMKKSGNTLVSQPMKGTNRKTADNEVQKALLRSDLKEVAENVMITDLVRNDLSKSAKNGSVRVDELCGVYEFEHVNQMISTVSAELRDDVHPLDAILNAFPMGSMTGAPKIRAMELIDEYEDFSRGLYSGAVGYFTPDLDFDFNVIIRSILYNEEKKVVTFPTGSAITINSDPEKEYDECMLKAEAMRKVLLNHAK
ncbi:MAG: anthranilate synthase component I family protein [Flavobacteriales bacterium]|jgi:para-aminobenzoate synthetase component 1|nr:anthranilate synthase component I family protein [Flavobacteriales bacterium]